MTCHLADNCMYNKSPIDRPLSDTSTAAVGIPSSKLKFCVVDEITL